MSLARDHAWLNVLAGLGVGRLAQRLTRSPGVIFRMERVLPVDEAMAARTRALCVSPQRLHRLVVALRRWGYDIIALDELPARLERAQNDRRFACLTFDFGYRDVLRHAWPVLHALRAPFTVYLNTNFADHLGEAWWLAFDPLVAKSKRLGLVAAGKEYQFLCASPAQKRVVRAALADLIWALPSDHDIRFVMRDLCARYGIDLRSFNQLFLDWGQVHEMAQDPLVSFGASSLSAPVLTKIPRADVRRELDLSRSVIEAAIGRRPKHLSYPFGTARALSQREIDIARDLGFASAVTARQAIVPRGAAAPLIHALPRIDVGGALSAPRHMRLFASGAARPRASAP